MLALWLFLSTMTVHNTMANKCAYIAIDGMGYPTNTCMYHEEVNPTDPTDVFLFSFQVACTDNSVLYKYWEGNSECTGQTDAVMPNDYCTAQPDGLTGEVCQCDGKGQACDTFTFGMTDTGASECQYAREERLTIVVNECIADGYGGSNRFSCDDSTLSLEQFPSTEDCTGEGSYEEIDYSQTTAEQCIYAKCNSGTRVKRKCHNQPPDIELEPIFMKHIQNQHLMVRTLRAQHKAKSVDWNALAHTPWVWLVFAGAMVFISGALGVYNRSEYTKI
eukprot:38890_1